jgi:hypothetical protein
MLVQSESLIHREQSGIAGLLAGPDPDLTTHLFNVLSRIGNPGLPLGLPVSWRVKVTLSFTPLRIASLRGLSS